MNGHLPRKAAFAREVVDQVGLPAQCGGASTPAVPPIYLPLFRGSRATEGSRSPLWIETRRHPTFEGGAIRATLTTKLMRTFP